MKNRTILVLSVSFALLISGAMVFGHAQTTPVSNPGAEIREATTKWLASLSPEQRIDAKVRYSDHARLDWQFVPRPKRKGLRLSDMTGKEKRLAIEVMRLALSAGGFAKIERIRDQQNYLFEVEDQDPPNCCGHYGNACG